MDIGRQLCLSSLLRHPRIPAPRHHPARLTLPHSIWRLLPPAQRVGSHNSFCAAPRFQEKSVAARQISSRPGSCASPAGADPSRRSAPSHQHRWLSTCTCHPALPQTRRRAARNSFRQRRSSALPPSRRRQFRDFPPSRWHRSLDLPPSRRCGTLPSSRRPRSSPDTFKGRWSWFSSNNHG